MLIEIKRNGYAKFINDLLKNKQYVINDEYYDLDSIYGSDEYVYKYSFSSKSAILIPKNEHFYDVVVERKYENEIIGDIYASEKVKEIISKPYRAMVNIEGGAKKKVFYNNDDEPKKYGDTEFDDYVFYLNITPLD